MKRWMLSLLISLIVLPIWSASTPEADKKDAAIVKALRSLNDIPEEQQDDKHDPVLSILRRLNDLDGPEYLSLRRLLGQASIRSTLKSGTRAILATLVSPRWDAYNVAGSLWLGGLRTTNADLRERASRKMIQFLQPAHIPVLIDMLKTPSAQAAHAVLREASGQNLPPDAGVWLGWWQKNKPTFDMIGYLLQDTRRLIAQTKIDGLEQDKIWYLTDGITDKSMPFEKRSPEEQLLIRRWNTWVDMQAKRASENWDELKPALERVTHHPDPRVNKLLEALVAEPGYGDYASLVLAWRQSDSSLPVLKEAFLHNPTVGRALARGSLGDKTALVDLLKLTELHQRQPMAWMITEEETRRSLSTLRSIGIIPAETALELLCHRSFGFDSAESIRQKMKAYEKAKRWLLENASRLKLDRRRGYYVVSKD